MHTADHIRSVIKGNYSTCCASVASVDFDFVDASVGVVNTATSAPQYQRFFQNNSSRFCQKYMITINAATMDLTY